MIRRTEPPCVQRASIRNRTKLHNAQHFIVLISEYAVEKFTNNMTNIIVLLMVVAYLCYIKIS